MSTPTPPGDVPVPHPLGNQPARGEAQGERTLHLPVHLAVGSLDERPNEGKTGTPDLMLLAPSPVAKNRNS
jgi:hypothetical protein